MSVLEINPNSNGQPPKKENIFESAMRGSFLAGSLGQIPIPTSSEDLREAIKNVVPKNESLMFDLQTLCPVDKSAVNYFLEHQDFSEIFPLDKDAPLTPQSQIALFGAQKVNYWHNLHEILESPACRRVLKRTKLRSRYLAYLYQVMAYSDYTFALRDVVAEEMGLPPYEEWTEGDVVDSPWMIPMSGSLAVDSEANFVCNWAMKSMDVDEALDAIRVLHNAHAALLSCSLTSFFRIPVIIPAEPEVLTEDSVCEYLMNFATPKQTNAERYTFDAEDAKIPQMTSLGVERILRDRTMFASPGVDICFKKPHKPVIQAEGAGILDENLFRGIRITEILGKGSINASNAPSPAEALAYDAAHDAMMQSLRIHWERIDELERSARRDALKKANNAIVDSEKEKRRLKKNLAWLELSAESEPTPATSQEEVMQERKAKAMKISELEGMVKDLRKTIETQNKEIKTLEAAVEKERQDRENAEQEYDALLAMLQDYQEKPEDTEDVALDTSIFGKKKIIIVGGHHSWMHGMRGLHPNIDIYGKDMPAASTAAIVGADMIWLQVNAINHPTYYKVMSLARTNNIPVKYFLRAGHVACRQQIVRETTEYFAKSK